VLVVRVPKADASRSRHIEVTRGSRSDDSTTTSEGNGGGAGSSTES
jgi:hypothetical protein